MEFMPPRSRIRNRSAHPRTIYRPRRPGRTRDRVWLPRRLRSLDSGSTAHYPHVYRPNNPELTKRYFREPPGQPRTHVHVRRVGSFSEQYPLLMRDYLRQHRQSADEYENVKRQLAEQFPHDGLAYTNAKGSICWKIIHRADEWAQQIGWEPGPSDA